jgi:hypothetical protein
MRHESVILCNCMHDYLSTFRYLAPPLRGFEAIFGVSIPHAEARG